MSLYLLLLLGHLFLASALNNGTINQMDITDLEDDEFAGLADVLGSLIDDPSWAEDHPKPCTDTPWPGIECEVDQDHDPPVFHITRIHIGLDVSNPPCKPSAYLSHSLDKLPYLRALSVFNCFTASPVSLTSSLLSKVTSSLEHLSLGSNPALIGPIPPVIGQAMKLRVLSLSQNGFQGSIPKEFGGLVNLEQLDLSYNNLSGEVPEIFDGLKSLSILDLSFNNFEGHAPVSLGQLKALQKLDLSSNKFDGTIPPSLGHLEKLVLMDLSYNFLNGPMPSSLSSLGYLEYLVLDHNPLHSGLPSFLGTLKCLKTASFSSCGLTGEIPTNVSSLNNLTALFLDGNNLKGTIPQTLGLLPNLDALNLSQNQLSGEVMIQEEFVSRLGKRLDVRGNKALCKGKMSYNKSVSYYLPIPDCLDASAASDNNSFGKRMKQENLINGSSSTKYLLMHHLQLFYPSFFALFIFLFLLQN